MKAITVREENTDSPNIGTVETSTRTYGSGIIQDALKLCLEAHYDAEVGFLIDTDHIDRLHSKGATDLQIVVGGDDDHYKTTITLETTWVY